MQAHDRDASVMPKIICIDQKQPETQMRATMQNREQMKHDQESHEHSIDWICGCQPAETNSLGKAPPVRKPSPRPKRAKRLAKLKTSDFEFYNRQRRDMLGEVYDPNLEVTYSDGWGQ
jgi:hypothetical protein